MVATSQRMNEPDNIWKSADILMAYFQWLESRFHRIQRHRTFFFKGGKAD